MARSALKCPKCNRKFAMAAHLARHMNAIHGAGRGAQRKTGRKRGRGRAGRARASRAPSFEMPYFSSAGPWADGSGRAIDTLKACQSELVAQRALLDAQIDAYSRAMETLGAAAPAGGGKPAARRGRPPSSGFRAGSLKDYIHRVLRNAGRPMSPNEIGTAVKKAGFRTKAKDLTKAVSNTLPNVKGVKKVGFGQYRATS